MISKLTSRYLMSLTVMLALFTTTPGQAATAVVETERGKVMGSVIDGIHSFKGIPYARPPVDKLRWQAPKQVKKSREVIEANDFGPICLQSRRPAQPAVEMNEDCLTLNVWTPALDIGKRPVMVWIHGGGFRAGSGNIAGEVFAAHDTVVVSMNYRLGPLGFFSHEVLNNKQANFGLLDMIQALQWVQANIGQFGGDPGNVTIFGVSAGGMAVDLLMVNDGADGLFHRAIAQSGYGTWALPRSKGAPQPAPLDMYMQQAERAGTMASELVGRVSEAKQTRRMLRKLDGLELVNALNGFQVPIVDGTSLKEEPGILFIQGRQHDVPFMTGGNSYEGSVLPGSGISIEDFKRSLGDDLAITGQLYKDDFDIDPARGLSRMFGDNRYLLAARVLGDNMKHISSSAWLYYIDFVTNDQQGKYPGTPHGSDAYLLFSGHRSEDEQIRALSGRLLHYWLNFARNGDPNGEGLVPWGEYQLATDSWMVFSDTDVVRSGVIQEKLDLIESRYRKRVGMPQANSRSR